jgi:Phosphotransferase enzyme family
MGSQPRALPADREVAVEQRRFADAGSLRPVVRAVFGAGRDVTSVERLPGGSKKGAYRVIVDDGVTVLVYVWNPAEDFWQGVLPPGAGDPLDPFSHASGLGLFEAAARRLAAAGVRCPRLLLADRSGELYPGDVAVVEHVPGGSLEAVLERDPAAASRPLAVLAGWLASMQACQAPAFGKVAVVDAGLTSHGGSCAQVVLERALREVDEISGRRERAAREAGRLSELLRALAEPLQPRGRSGLVHGELGPDHILLDRDGDPVLIDIEGAMYFDAEWEHAFLRLRFGDHYPLLGDPALDQDRLRFYQLAQHLDLVAGPLRIADSGHPEREWFLNLAGYHLDQALRFQP